ncbi:MAG: MBL fold metallo-hydrolase [Planctomycetota bacterium]
MTTQNPVQIRSVPLGAMYQTNCYTVQCANELWIVDAGFEPEPLLELVADTGLTPTKLILTHAHPDHIAGVPAVLERHPGTPVLIHEAEQRWLTDANLNLSALMGKPLTIDAPDGTLAEGDTLTLGTSTWRVLHTPGHSPGSISLACDQVPVVIAGDALFAGSVGRTDFPNGSPDVLAESIRSKLYTLPDNTTVFPGHGPSTTIGHEKATNPFVTAVG